MDLRALLAAATRPAHQSLERLIGLEGAASAERFAWYLLAMHAIVAAVEREIACDPRLERLGLGLAQRRKLAWLEDDLRGLGLAPLGSPCAPPIPADVPRRVGWAYVFEGATLGGRVLLKGVAPRLGLTRERGAAFLHGHGERTGEMWRGFVAALNAIAFDAVEIEACIAGATQAFTAIEEAFRAVSVARPHAGLDRQLRDGLAA